MNDDLAKWFHLSGEFILGVFFTFKVCEKTDLSSGWFLTLGLFWFFWVGFWVFLKLYFYIIFFWRVFLIHLYFFIFFVWMNFSFEKKKYFKIIFLICASLYSFFFFLFYFINLICLYFYYCAWIKNYFNK